MKLNKIYNEDCLTFIPKIEEDSLDLVITSPPYNTSVKKKYLSIEEAEEKKKCGKLEKGWTQHANRYDIFQYQKTDKEYSDFISNIFKSLYSKLKDNGVVCWNVSYGMGNPDCLNQSVWTSINSIIKSTPFEIADFIAWKKPSVVPLTNGNGLTRYCEMVIIFCKKGQLNYFHSNLLKEKRNKCIYTQPHNNLVKTKSCNDGECVYNHATYSSELVEKLILLYGKEKGLVYDPFMGTGTTAVGAIECGLNYLGTELSTNQIAFAENRIKQLKGNSLWF